MVSQTFMLALHSFFGGKSHPVKHAETGSKDPISVNGITRGIPEQ